jgi:hypothetical protein
VPTNGLVGWWPFNGNANDESGNGNNGILLSGTSLVADRNGYSSSAVGIDGVSCVNKRGVEIPAIINQSNNYSISCWFRIADLAQGFQTIFCSNPHNTIGVSFNHPFGQNVLSSSVGDGTSWLYTGQSGNTFNSNNYTNWNHLLVVKALNNIKYYVNGFLVRVQPINNLISNITFSLDFGTIDFSAWGCYETLNGSLDDIGIWNRALTECEIQDLYHAQVGFTTVDAGQDQTICRGTDVTLNGTGGSSLSWNNGVVNGVAFAPNQTSNYVLTGSDSLGCVGTDTVLVTVLDNALSTINQTAIDSYTLNGQTYTQSGTYTQVLTAANGCDSIITLNLELDFTGIQTSTLPSLKLYPNPVQDVLHIEGLAGKEFEYEVLSIDGKLLQNGKSQGEISVKELRKGNYVLRVGQQQVSFVKQ